MHSQDEVGLDKVPGKVWPHIPTGLPIFDNTYGSPYNCPGLPRGRIVVVEGSANQGKSTIALKATANAVAAGNTVAYIDLNLGFVPGYAARLGVPIEDHRQWILVHPSDQDEGLHCMEAFVGKADLIIVDGLISVSDSLWDPWLARLKKAGLGDTAVLVLGSGIPLPWKYHASRVYLLEEFQPPNKVTFTIRKDALDRGQGVSESFTVEHV